MIQGYNGTVVDLVNYQVQSSCTIVDVYVRIMRSPQVEKFG